MVFISSSERRRATHAARVLGKALPPGSAAKNYELAGKLYVVTSTGGDGSDVAYLASDVSVARAKGWDYSAWRADMVREESRDVAVCYFMETRRDLAQHAVLRPGQRAALTLLAEGKPCLRPTPEQIEVLEIAKTWGWSLDPKIG